MNINFIGSLKKLLDSEFLKSPAAFNQFTLENPWVFNALSHERIILAKKDLQGIVFSNSEVLVDLSGKSFLKSNISFCNFLNVLLQGANLEKAVAEKTDFSGANLSGANLSGAILKKARLHGTNLEGAIFDEANLEGAFLQGVIVNESTIFSNANLSGAHLGGSDLRNVCFHGATLDGTDFDQSNLWGEKGLPTKVVADHQERFVESLPEDEKFRLMMELTKRLILKIQRNNGNGNGHKGKIDKKLIEKLAIEFATK